MATNPQTSEHHDSYAKFKNKHFSKAINQNFLQVQLD